MANRFFINIARERGARAGEPDATITVDVSGGQALATELTIRASKGGSVDRASLPVIDALMRALSTDESPATREAGPTRAAVTASVDRGAAEAPVRSTRSRSTRAKAAAGGRRAKATAGGRGRRASATTPADGGRAYRRMPEPDQVLAAYQEVGTINGLADYFGVPQHTVKGWARRMRQLGYELAR
jgi:hypothetical protein